LLGIERHDGTRRGLLSSPLREPIG
jgi:hypothetical protein